LSLTPSLFQGRKEERIHNIIDTVTPSPFSFFSSILTTPIKKCFATLHPLSLSLSLSLFLLFLLLLSSVVIAIIKKRRIEEEKTIREEKILSTK